MLTAEVDGHYGSLGCVPLAKSQENVNASIPTFISGTDLSWTVIHVEYTDFAPAVWGRTCRLCLALTVIPASCINLNQDPRQFKAHHQRPLEPIGSNECSQQEHATPETRPRLRQNITILTPNIQLL